MRIGNQTDLADIVVKVEVERARIERELVACVLADPTRESCARGVAVAVRAGVEPEWFDHEDYRIIYIAALLGHQQGLPKTLELARRGLRHFGLWDDTAPSFSRSQMWSNEKLDAIAEVYPGCSFVGKYARQLRKLRGNLVLAEEHIYQAMRCLVAEVA